MPYLNPENLAECYRAITASIKLAIIIWIGSFLEVIVSGDDNLHARVGILRRGYALAVISLEG